MKNYIIATLLSCLFLSCNVSRKIDAKKIQAGNGIEIIRTKKFLIIQLTDKK